METNFSIHYGYTNLLAFLAHTFLEFVDLTYRAIRQKLAARKRFFHDFNTPLNISYLIAGIIL